MASILIVDDQQPLRFLMRRWLEEAGHDIFEASNGREALEVCDRHRPEMVITDIFMPDKEGLGLIRTLRRQSLGVKIIAISGGSDSVAGNFLGMAQMLGAVGTLEKPFTGNQLLEAVCLALRGSTAF
jgi:DNA-binding response OmpR family regulator